MKLGVGKLIALCAIGIYWSWACRYALAAKLTTSDAVSSSHHRSEYIRSELRLVKDRSPAASDSSIPGSNYKSHGEWIGRLILPTESQISMRPERDDWVWVEIECAPSNHSRLIGKKLRLTWQFNPQLRSAISKVTTDIHFTPETIASQRQGNIHPQRLNFRTRVGPLQSLAGARAVDDVWVRLDGVQVKDESSNNLILEIDREPIQITGTLKGLVQILGTDSSRAEPLPTACPGAKPCPSEYFRVRHYHPNSHAFDGQIETIRIPQIPAKKSGLFPSTIRDLASSPAGTEGWYIYGDFARTQLSQNNPQNLFTVAAIQPKSLFTIQNPVLSNSSFSRRETRRAQAAKSTIHNLHEFDAKLDYLNRQHWTNTPAKKGQIERVIFTSGQQHPKSEKLGDKALVIHTFGGIGGKTGDNLGLTATVTGHFAYGIATVVRDEFTNQLQWSIEYNQVYAHNPDGIVAGRQDWATYMGQLQRGWLATRPVADLLIGYPPVTEDYDFGGIKLSPLAELQHQLQVASARYRTGDGTGNASVTPATSCVQDANQALYVTIKQLNRAVRSQPQIQAWLDTHSQDPQTLRFGELQALGRELESNLAPLGIVRQDWQQNAAKLAGISVDTRFTSSGNPILGLMSWRTMLPRGAQDGMAKIFSRRGATIWFFNTYQVGGENPDIFPIAPTVLFGQIPLLSTIVLRLWAGIVTLPDLKGWWLGLGLLGSYSIVALPLGFKSGFLTLDRQFGSLARSLVHLFFLPALLEEILFRLLLIPHPIETVISRELYLWMTISLGLFIIYHPLNALTLYKTGHPIFMDWRFLTLTGLLGIVCAIAYTITGSIWSAVIIHWVVVVAWLHVFGGRARLQSSSTVIN